MKTLDTSDPNSPSRKTPDQTKADKAGLYECRCGFQTHNEEKLELHYDNGHPTPQSTQPNKLDKILVSLWNEAIISESGSEWNVAKVSGALQAITAHFLEIVEGSKPKSKNIDQEYDEGFDNGIDEYETNLTNNIKGEK